MNANHGNKEESNSSDELSGRASEWLAATKYILSLCVGDNFEGGDEEATAADAVGRWISLRFVINTALPPIVNRPLAAHCSNAAASLSFTLTYTFECSTSLAETSSGVHKRTSLTTDSFL